MVERVVRVQDKSIEPSAGVTDIMTLPETVALKFEAKDKNRYKILDSVNRKSVPGGRAGEDKSDAKADEKADEKKEA